MENAGGDTRTAVAIGVSNPVHPLRHTHHGSPDHRNHSSSLEVASVARARSDAVERRNAGACGNATELLHFVVLAFSVKTLCGLCQQRLLWQLALADLYALRVELNINDVAWIVNYKGRGCLRVA